ncbi:MAG: DNA repair ATPase [Lysobacteraceae bacterium]|nr:MAG: DNA repair ATPase [Xanthomonadaceae bacterium]
MQLLARSVLLAPVLVLVGCSSAYYATMENFGYQKREILVDRVEDARDAQEATAKEFESALEQFSSVVDFDGGDLEDLYDRLSDAYEDSESRANDVSDRVDAVENVAEALFEEWEDEIDQYENDSFRRTSSDQLRETKRRYGQLMSAMRRAESKMEPVLSAFRDQVLFIKHNLNARAIASLENELDRIESDVADLVRDMKQSMAEADEFIREMQSA